MEKILIVEDDLDIAELERDYLEANGFAVAIAGDGLAGEKAALDEKVDLVLLDIMLPGMDGFQVCRRIREKRNIPILLVSARQEDVDKIRGLGLGTDDYIVKPFSPGELVARVKAHLQRYRQLTGLHSGDQLLRRKDLTIDRKGHYVYLKGKEIAMPNHTVATKIVIDALLSAEYGSVKSMDEIEAVGHRIVHGGAYFSESVLLTDEVLAKLELCRDLAPLHTGAHIMGIQGCLAAMPKTPQVLVFDTAFHTASMPDYAYVYPVSYDMYEKYAVRRYGAHGTSHRYVSGECIKLLGGKAEGTKIVTCHLGNGSSISAVKDGKVLDTSMGFTPLAGIEMGTRCGDIDPAIVPYIMNKTGMNADEMNEYMNKKCGFLGVSGISSDCRDVSAAAKAGNKRAKLALDIVSYQIR